MPRHVTHTPENHLLAQRLGNHFANVEAVLPHDTYGRDFGLFIAEKLPFILGTNVAGIVKKLGAKVTKYSIGDHIFGQAFIAHPTPDQAGLQEYAVLEVAATAGVPKGFTDDDVVTLPVNAVTAFAALFHPAGLNLPPPFATAQKTFDYKAQTVVIVGGGSNVGKVATQLAALAGIGKIVVVASASHEKQLLGLGANPCFRPPLLHSCRFNSWRNRS